MKKTDKLRERAEEKLQKTDKKPRIFGSESELVHELQVHQTELEMQNEELRNSQIELSNLYEEYHELYNEAPVGYFSLDNKGNVRNVNIKGAELLGLEKDRIIGFGFIRFIPSNYQTKYYTSLKNAVVMSKIQEVELKLKREKSLFYVQMEIIPIHDKPDEKYRIIITDITERKQAEDELRENEEKLRRLFEVIPVGISILDKEKKILYNNPALEKIMELSKADLLKGKHVKRKYIRSDMTEMPFNELPTVKAFNEQKSVKNVEIGIIKEDNSITWTNVSALPLLFSDWKILAITNDITQRKQSEEELRQVRDNLEENVEERTVELKEAYQNLKENELQLKGMVKELKRSNEELQRFTYITSHDLQEPIRTIVSFTQLLQRRYEGRFDSDADEFMNFVVDASIRMKDMIQGLLEYSSVKTQVEEFKDFNAEEALKKALDNLKLSRTECEAEITHDALPVIHANENQITRVFQNLISNALKFRKEMFPPRIHISAQRKNNEWIFSVSDNGIGMETQYIDKIFEVFRRLHTIDEYEGTGIGLAIVERIIISHGGCIWVESEYGVGSTFYFTLPIKE